MTENHELVIKRQQIETAIQAGKYKSLGGVIIDGLGKLVQKLSFAKAQPPFWYNGLLFTLLTFLACLIVSSVFSSDGSALNDKEFWSITLSGFLAILISSLIAIVGVILHSKLLTTLDGEVIEAIETQKDLNDQEHWLGKTFNWKSELAKSLLPAIVFFSVVLYLRELLSGERLGIGVYLVAIIAGFEVCTTLSVVLAVFAMLNRLSQYELKLFAMDPCNSKVIDRLSEMINSLMLITAIMLTIISLLGFIGNPLEVSVFFLLPWIVIISVFVSGHYALSKIIRKSKWQILADIQSQIETLQAKSVIISEESLSHINKLMDFHNRIKSTRNSAIDIRSGFSLLQSFLLPVLGLVVANFLSILDIVARISQGK